ncbi:MAG: hypothetical protein EHM12_10780 [Dehalococcoidia bacterium]|nr:MAG: hypothetical protein EHM12_10780 [Dehalococcoidia bacterium]
MKLLTTGILGIIWFLLVYTVDKRFRIVPKPIHFILLCIFIASTFTFVVPLILGFASIPIGTPIIHLIAQRMEFFGIGMILLLPFPASLLNRVENKRNLITTLVAAGIGVFCLSWMFYAFYDFYGVK